ncbi:MAG: hypothetical protein ABR562_02170 [Thermoplasmatota archaeon]
MAMLAPAAKPAILIGLAGLALGALGIVAWRAMRRGVEPADLLPAVDVAGYNDALLAP